MGTNLEIAAASNQPAPPADLTGDHRASAMPRTALGRTLWRQGTVSARQIAEAEASVRQTGARLADHLRLSLFLPAATITQAEADVAGAGVIDPAAEPPQPHLVHKLGASACLRHGLLPWRASGGETIVITARPDRFDRHRDRLTDLFGPVRMAISTEPAIQTALGQIASSHLVVAAETLTATEDSCRTWSVGRARLVACATLALFVALTLWSPAWVATVCVGWAVIAMIANIGQRIAAAIALAPKRNPRADTNQPPTPIRLPVVTIFVPLFQEKAIAGQLIANLSRLDYPSALLDVCILLEEDDHVTRDVLDRTNLPRWLRAITVPRGTVKTKPRALNYGLNFARGEIIGVYDAEDAPDPDQIRKMVAQFAASPPEVACLQGVLDFYNTGHNWLARCFTIEYATWFRLVLPGLARLGFVIPLGGTTLFFRRSVLEEIGGWDAHNVTEDADLGVRLARRGYRTELLDSATMEEANASAWLCDHLLRSHA